MLTWRKTPIENAGNIKNRELTELQMGFTDPFSMKPTAFAVWSILAIFTTFYLFNWIWKKRKYRHAILFNRRERVALKATPRIGVAWAALLIAFLFVNLDSVYLLIVFPLVYLFVNYQVAKKLKDRD